jgi:heme-degrading monooxygenase HmoA
MSEGKARLVVSVRLKPGSEKRFLAAYDAIHQRVSEEIPGHIAHQLCQSLDDPACWIITSEWENVEASAWDGSEEHRKLVTPLRDCFEEGSSEKFEVRVESSPAAP